MEFPQDYFGSAADRSHALAARRLVLRDTRKEVRPPQASVQPYHPYAHEQWRSRWHAANQQQQQRQQQQQTNEPQNGMHVVNHQEKRYVPTPTGHAGAPPASPAALSSSYRRILLLGPSSHSSNASDRLVSLQNPRNNYYNSSQYNLTSRGGGACESDVGREAAPPQFFRREVVRRENDRERVTVNFLGAMASRRMEMLPRAKDVDDGDRSKYAGLDVSLHL